MGRLPFDPEVLAQRDERLGRGVVEVSGVVGPLDLVDVEVARRTGDGANPGEVLPGLLAHVLGEHSLGVAEHDTRTAHRHAQVVEELRIDVGDCSVPVGDHRFTEVGEDGAIPVDSPVVGGQRHTDGYVVARQRDAGRRRSQLGAAAVDLDETEPFDQVTHLRRRFRIAGQLDDVDEHRDHRG